MKEVGVVVRIVKIEADWGSCWSVMMGWCAEGDRG